MNVEMTNISYIKLANSRLVMEGYCVRCSGKLLKTKVMPKSGMKKEKKLLIMTMTKRKRRRRRIKK
jgi:hypothetical protein